MNNIIQPVTTMYDLGIHLTWGIVFATCFVSFCYFISKHGGRNDND